MKFQNFMGLQPFFIPYSNDQYEVTYRLYAINILNIKMRIWLSETHFYLTSIKILILLKLSSYFNHVSLF